jgi:hypothetical protein
MVSSAAEVRQADVNSVRESYPPSWMNYLVDVYILSYPKSGRTWLRLMVGKVLALRLGLENADLLELYQLTSSLPDVPQIRASHDESPHLKTVCELSTSKMRYRDERVILLVRDPRDVMVSCYFQETKRNMRYRGSISSFIRDERHGVDGLIHWLNVWSANRSVPSDFLLVRYEDMHVDTEGELRKVVDFLGLDGVHDSIIRQAVEFASFDNMRRMEAEDALDSARLRPGHLDDAESFKVRRGKVGGYVDYLSGEDIAYLDAKIRTELAGCFGYAV